MNSPSSRKRPSRATRIVLGLVAAALVLLIGFGSGMAVMWAMGPQLRRLTTVQPPAALGDQPDIPLQERLGLLEEIWDILQDTYIEPQELDVQEMVYGAASGFVEAVGDPHTAFVEPIQAAIIEEDMQGSFEGIGATVEMREGVLTIVRPLPNSPAERVGIEAGDQVLEVDGQSIEGMDIMEAITLIRGPRGTTVRLLVQREGIAEPFEVEIVRDRIEMQITEARMLEGNVAYLGLSEFNARSAQQVRAELKTQLEHNPTGLILDLRNNPGGYLQMAIEVASEFLPGGTLVVTERERDAPDRELRASRGGLALEIPLVVLVNGGSASASEIVAGAIQDHGRGILVGETTFGKGSVQQTHTLSDGSSLRVTIAKWVLPGGRILDGDGLTPDIQVSTTPEEVAQGRDVQLERAVEYLLENAS